MAGQDWCSCKRVPGRQPGLHISMPGQLGALRQKGHRAFASPGMLHGGWRKERKTDGCQTGNRRAPAEGVGIRKRLWRRYGRNDRGWGQGGGNGGEEYSPKKPISCNDEPSSDAPQTKQTKQPIRLIVRDIPRLNVCVCVCARR